MVFRTPLLRQQPFSLSVLYHLGFSQKVDKQNPYSKQEDQILERVRIRQRPNVCVFLPLKEFTDSFKY